MFGQIKLAFEQHKKQVFSKFCRKRAHKPTPAELSTVITAKCSYIFTEVVYNPLLDAWAVLGTRIATSAFAPF
jgi:hypothetical protein